MPQAPQPRRPPLDQWFEHTFGDEGPTRLGSGWAAGVASVFLGAVALLAVVVLWFPGWLSTARFRPHYPLPLLRAVIEGVIATAFAAGVLSLLRRRRRKVLGLTGCALSLVAALLGGGGVARAPGAAGTGDPPLTVGLDWFLLNLFLLALVFVPMERLFPRWPEQGTFRPGWLLPLVLLGFASAALHAYLVFVSFHAVFIHANLRFSFGALERVLVTPRFHHWHHAAEEAARDRNFAVHLPILDRVFGTEHLPTRGWPEGYGIAGAPVPAGWGGQLVYPFHRPDRLL